MLKFNEFIKKRKWYLYTNYNEYLNIHLKNEDVEDYLQAGDYFEAIKLNNGDYYVTNKGNTGLLTKSLIYIEDDFHFNIFEEEEDTIEASQNIFKGYVDPTGNKFKNSLDQIGIPIN